MLKIMQHNLLGIILLIFTQACYALPNEQNVLDDIEIFDNEHSGVIKINFRSAIRYISHSPKSTGKEVLIKIALINKQRSNQRFRESIVPYYDDSYGLEDVSFEKIQNESFLTLHFNKAVSFKIIQNADYRSLSIIIHNPS